VSPEGKQLFLRWGKAVRVAREGQGRTQAGLARCARTTQSTISKIELGDLAPSDVLKVRIAHALGRQVDELFDFPWFAKEWVGVSECDS
jgi:DNA-binding XRE family transcriptional regulator